MYQGMFNNANVIFRTKFVEGISTVTRTAINNKKGKKDGQLYVIYTYTSTHIYIYIYIYIYIEEVEEDVEEAEVKRKKGKKKTNVAKENIEVE